MIIVVSQDLKLTGWLFRIPLNFVIYSYFNNPTIIQTLRSRVHPSIDEESSYIIYAQRDFQSLTDVSWRHSAPKYHLQFKTTFELEHIILYLLNVQGCPPAALVCANRVGDRLFRDAKVTHYDWATEI